MTTCPAPQEHTAELRGHRCWYVRHGDSGPPVLLIMGFGFSGVGWQPQAERLSPDHQVVYYDNRGIGRSSTGDGPHTLAGLADDAAALLDHLGWGSAHVAGVSMGGMVAQHLAIAHPDRVRSLTLIATSPGPFRRCRPTATGLRLFLRANTRTGTARLEALRDLLFPADPAAQRADHGFSLEQLARIATPSDPRIRTLHLRSILGHDVRRALEGLRVPTLVLQPARDVLVPPHCSDELAARIPGARLLRFPRAGHGLTSQEADAVSEALAEHVARAERARCAPA